jgi:hypothetical protein
VPPRTVREGWIVFSVPMSVEADDLAVVWTDNTYDAALAVHWEARPSGTTRGWTVPTT